MNLWFYWNFWYSFSFMNGGIIHNKKIWSILFEWEFIKQSINHDKKWIKISELFANLLPIIPYKCWSEIAMINDIEKVWSENKTIDDLFLKAQQWKVLLCWFSLNSSIKIKL